MRNNLKKILTAVILTALILATFIMLTAPAPSVRADTSEVNVVSYSWYVAPSNTIMAENPGDLVAVGEIQNVGSNVIGSAYVAGYAYNSTGGVLDSQETLAYFQDLLPGQKAPFYIDFLPESSPTQDQTWVPSVTNVTVQATYVSDTNAAQYSGLTIPQGSTTSSVDSTGTYTVTGTVKNTGNETAGNVYVDATFYNSSGSVISLYITNYLSSSLAPGASVAVYSNTNR